MKASAPSMSVAHRISRGAEMPDIYIREVGLRDGLQSSQHIMSPADKIEWCRDAVSAGISEIEVTSFVPPKLLPQFADAAEIVEAALKIEGLTVAALAPNLHGAKAAAAAGVARVNCVVAVSEGHNQSNLRRSTETAIEEFGRIVVAYRELELANRPIVVAGMATCFGCTIDGHIPSARVREVAQELKALGADEFLIADTVGYANPAAVKRLFTDLRSDLGPRIKIAAHFHDTRGTGLANVLSAIEAGVTHFDTSLGGLGGCPYAPGATGNIVTEDTVYMLEAMGLRTGIDLEALLKLRKRIQALLPGDRFEGALARAGIPLNYRH